MSAGGATEQFLEGIEQGSSAGMAGLAQLGDARRIVEPTANQFLGPGNNPTAEAGTGPGMIWLSPLLNQGDQPGGKIDIGVPWIRIAGVVRQQTLQHPVNFTRDRGIRFDTPALPELR